MGSRPLEEWQYRFCGPNVDYAGVCTGRSARGPVRRCQNRRMRQEPSAADAELIQRLRDEHATNSSARFEVSPTKLERWRAHGLLPRVKVEHPGFGGTRVPSHPEEVVDAARLLGRTSRRGRPWQLTAELLFNAGFPLSDAALRGTATYLMRAETAGMERAWAAATAEAPPTRGAAARGAEIGQRAAEKLPRFLKLAVRNEIVLAHGSTTSRAAIEEYAERALTWRMVDFSMPVHERMKLTKKEQNLARHGVEEPMFGLGGLGVLPLPSERTMIAETLTWAEAQIYRTFAALRIHENPALEGLGLFTVMTWIVASERLNTPPHDLTIAVAGPHLEQVKAMLSGPV